ncbi:ATP-binding cassette sub-family D member 4 [Amphibalanus amphitrite]|uniref:ATP-binding cassette sub-family D member 4 n=1 Tax=Amphibalanus amphitrite TaxID=1232801 RepID=A0A6A4X3I3_AMPAM|nr:ATP-binding cassette sub-family D member 4 [Amphibalanus amphitrite]
MTDSGDHLSHGGGDSDVEAAFVPPADPAPHPAVGDDPSPPSEPEDADSDGPEPASRRYGLDATFCRRARVLLGVMFPSCGAYTVFLLMALMVACGAEQYVVYWVGIIPSRYYQVLGDKDLDAFGVLTSECLGLVLVISFVKGTRIFLSTVLYVNWRQLIDRALHRRYFAGINYYLLNVLDQRIDNPDQRITQDVDKMCKTLSTMIAQLLVAPFIIGYYTYAVYSNTGYIGVLSIYGFFVVATVVNKVMMTPIVTYVVRQEEKEGTFRFKHMQIRVHAEALGFHGCSVVEEHRCNRRLGALVATQLALFNRRFMLTLVVNLFDYLGSILNYLVIAIPIFAGMYDDKTPQQLSAIISQNSFVCMYLIYNFTQLVDLSSNATEVVGVTHRIGQLMERLDTLQRRRESRTPSPEPAGGDGKAPPPPGQEGEREGEKGGEKVAKEEEVMKGGAEKKAEDGDESSDADPTSARFDTPYRLHSVTVRAPGGRQPLVSDLSLTVRRGRSLLVTGSSSRGKTSLLRVLRGLWLPAAGSVRRTVLPGPRHVFFMPQRPFFTDGSLRQQIVYPERLKEDGYSTAETEQMLHYLQLTQLTGLAERCGGLDADVARNWYDLLSPGEMQRLCFVRLFHHRPSFVFMDEATSAVSPDMEEILYQECLRLQMTLFSVGHRESLTSYHDWKLHLLGGGRWSLEPIAPPAYRAAQE